MKPDMNYLKPVRFVACFLVFSLGVSLMQVQSQLSLEAFQAFRKQGIIIDARNDVAYQRGHVPGALSLPYERFAVCYGKLKPLLEADKNQPITIYCNGGGCGSSEEEHKKFVNMGYTRVSVFAGGWVAWQQAKLPEEKSKGGVDAPLRPWKKPPSSNPSASNS